MHHFFADPARIGEKEITLTGADVNHIRNVLRMRPGEEVLISDGQRRSRQHFHLRHIDHSRF